MQIHLGFSPVFFYVSLSFFYVLNFFNFFFFFFFFFFCWILFTGRGKCPFCLLIRKIISFYSLLFLLFTLKEILSFWVILYIRHFFGFLFLVGVKILFRQQSLLSFFSCFIFVVVSDFMLRVMMTSKNDIWKTYGNLIEIPFTTRTTT